MNFADFDIDAIRCSNDANELYRQLENHPLYIYGAGGFGREFYATLRQYGIVVKGFLDRNADHLGTVCGCNVYTAETLCKTERNGALVLVAIVMDKDERISLLKNLHALGYRKVYQAQFYRSLTVAPSGQIQGTLKEYYIQHLPRIQKAWELLADEKSREIFAANIRAYFWRDYSRCVFWEDTMCQQYFPKDIPLSKGYRCFVDCGAYIGDTIEVLTEAYPGATEMVVAFEPNLKSYQTMIQTISALVSQRICFPCAVDRTTGKKRFSTGYGSGTLSQDGDDEIICVSLDDALQGVQPTFIKMDIEGAEFDALKGAKKIIADSRPDLAICVYHNIDHMWEIPLLLEKMELGYQFYLRSYNACTMETVLYASIPSERGEVL